MADEQVDAFGRPIEVAAVAPVAVAAPVVGVDAIAPTSVENHHGDGDKSKQAVYEEYLRLRAELESRFPEAAKKLSAAALDMSPTALQQARDEAQGLKNAEEGKEVQKAIMGGAMAVAGVGALLGGSTDKNPQFDKLLADLGAGDKAALALVSGGNDIKNLDSLKPNDGLPSLVAALESTKSASAGRGITA